MKGWDYFKEYYLIMGYFYGKGDFSIENIEITYLKFVAFDEIF